MDQDKKEKNTRITYENEYDQHIMDLKLKIMHKFLVDATVLDVGCGETEGVYRRIGRIMKKYVGIEKDLESPKKVDNCEYCIDTLETFNSQEKFDVVILFGTIEECNDVDQHLLKAKSLLNEKGNIFISIPNPWALNRIMGVCNGYIDKPESLDIHDIKQGHRRLFTIEELKKEVEKNGLKAKNSWPIGFKPLPMSEMNNLKKYWHQFDNLMQYGKEYGIQKYCAGWLLQASND